MPESFAPAEGPAEDPRRDPREEGDSGISVKEIADLCQDSPGYIIFAARISNKTNEKGDLMLEFLYRRYHLAFDDAIAASIAMKAEVKKDIAKFMGNE
jgi:hypothetical protein